MLSLLEAEQMHKKCGKAKAMCCLKVRWAWQVASFSMMPLMLNPTVPAPINYEPESTRRARKHTAASSKWEKNGAQTSSQRKEIQADMQP